MNKQELNKCARKLHEAYLSTGDYSLFDTPEYYSAWREIFSAFAAAHYRDSNRMTADLIADVLMTAIKYYDFDRGIPCENFFNKCLSNKKKTQQTKDGKKQKKETSLDMTVTDSEGNETSLISLTEAEDEEYDIEETYDKRTLIYNLYLMGSELALKRPSGKTDGEMGSRDKKALFYKKLIFTDMLSACGFVMENTREFFRYNTTKLSKSVDFDFANSYYMSNCSTVIDFISNEFRPYSDFTHDPKHEGKPCADLSNFAREHKDDSDTEKAKTSSLGVLYLEVYTAYVQAALGESISKSQISTKRNDFSAALIEAFKTQLA